MSELFSVDLRGGATWSHVLKRGTALHLVDLEGGANAAVTCFNFENLSERSNLPGTLKAQHIARLASGFDLKGNQAAGTQVYNSHVDVLVLIFNCPQLNNSCNSYNPVPVRLLVWE